MAAFTLLILTVGSARSAHGEGVFFIERPKLGIGTVYDYEEEKRTVLDTETKRTVHDMREQVTIGTGGWIYHPSLISYRFSFEPEWRQESFRQSPSTAFPDQTGDRDTSVLAYDAKTTFLKQKPLSLDLFANRSTRQIDLPYTRDTDIETESWGSRLNFTNTVMPVTLSFTNRQSDQTGFYTTDENRNVVAATIRHNLKRSVSQLNLLRDDTDKTARTDLESTDITSDAAYADFTNTLFFSGDERVKLDSLVYLGRAEYNDARIDSRLLTENFYWAIGKNMLTQYTFHFDRRESDGVDTEEKAFDALLIHHRWESLTTTLGGGAAFGDFTGGGEDRYSSKLGVNFRRTFSRGTLELDAAYDYGKTDRTGGGKVIPTEERHLLATGEEALLKADNIVVESIVVTDATGTVVYVENIDYRIEGAGSDVRISRSLLGAIPDGQEVIVRYNYRVDTAYDDTRFGQRYRFDLGLWSFMSLTLTHYSLDQRVVSGEPPAFGRDSSENSVRLRFDGGWSETRLEYEAQDRENGTSSITRSVRERITPGTFGSLTLNLSGHYGKREFTDSHESETFYTYGADIAWQPEWWCTVSLVGRRSDVSGDRQEMMYSEISPKIQMTFGVWSVSGAYRLTDQEDRDSGNRLWRQRLYFVVNRALW